MASLNWLNKQNLLNTWDKLSASFSKPPLPVKTNFFRLLAVGQKVGLWLRESLISISMSEHNKVMKSIIDDMIEQVNQWSSLYIAMQKHDYFFSSTEIELIRAAQGMGNMPETLEGIALEMENFAQITKKIKGALTYPLTLLLFAIGATAILLVKVVPTIVTLYPNKDSLPGITQLMLNVSDFMIQWWYMLLWGVISIIVIYNVLYKYFLPFKILMDGTLLRIPTVWDAIKTFHMYRFSKLLWDFMFAGVDQISAMTQISRIFTNFFYKKKAEDIKADLNAWFTFADTIEWSNLFDPILIQIIVVWESTGNLWEILQTMSGFYKEQLLQKISAVMAFVEPILMLFIAWLIGSIVGAIYLPLIDMVNVIGG